MKCTVRPSIVFCSALLVLGASSLANAEPLFFDDFEDRVDDQATIGNNWTWYDQWFEGDTCGVNYAGGGGPCDNDGDCDNDYEQDNRNFTNAGAEAVETSIKDSKQGLGITKGNKRNFHAQEMLVLLAQLATT